jgi:hypothetical protein
VAKKHVASPELSASRDLKLLVRVRAEDFLEVIALFCNAAVLVEMNRLPVLDGHQEVNLVETHDVVGVVQRLVDQLLLAVFGDEAAFRVVLKVPAADLFGFSERIIGLLEPVGHDTSIVVQAMSPSKPLAFSVRSRGVWLVECWIMVGLPMDELLLLPGGPL